MNEFSNSKNIPKLLQILVIIIKLLTNNNSKYK